MGFNLRNLFSSSAIALSLAIAPLLATPLALTVTAAPALAQRNVVEDLNLTPEQKSRLQDIQRNTRVQLQSLLTPEQKQAFMAQINSGATVRQAVRSLDLTDAQKNQLQSVLDNSFQQAMNVLTPEQVDQLQSTLSGD